MPKSTSRRNCSVEPRDTTLLAELRPAELSLCGGGASFLQSDFWGSFKERFGWKAFAFSAEWKAVPGTSAAGNGGGHNAADAGGTRGAPRLPLLVLYRRLGLGIAFAYVPWGPELPASYDRAASEVAAAELAPALRTFLPKDTAFIRFDFPWFGGEEVTGQSVTSGGASTLVNDRSLTRAVAADSEPRFSRTFTRAAANVQPPDSVLVDLIPDEQTILARMKSKWRYNIGLAEKKGVVVRSANLVTDRSVTSVRAGDRVDDRSLTSSAESDAARTAQVDNGLASYYRIYKETAERDGISIHGMNYYAALFEEAAKHGVDTRLYMASHDGEDIAGIVTLFRGKEAVYLYGASANHKRNLMAPYALQWKAMRDAKAAGCVYYDMFGIPPRPPEEDPNHPMAGLYRFKTGFIGDNGEGGRIIHRPGSWDYNCRPLAKALYSAAEAARKKVWDLKKRLKRR